MGASDFSQRGRGPSAAAAFKTARAQAQYEHGHGGYSGTLAEKNEFVLIEVPAGVAPQAYATELMDKSDPRIDNKWGPAGCVKLSDDEYLFFGWASS